MEGTSETGRAAIEAGALRDKVKGSVFVPGDEGWDEARSAWNLAVDQHPRVVVAAADADDVAAAVLFARENGLYATAQATGHSAAVHGPLENGLLIKTAAMDEVSVDPETRIARVGAGVTWGAVVPAAQEHGLIALAGSSHDVGVIGYHLGGGLSFLARAHGLACDRVRAIELVTADGSKVRATSEEEADLFWALRGGGGNFGIVTALEFELMPVGEIHAGSFFFPHERSGEVFEAWHEWTRELPDEMTTDVRMMQFPPIPDIPEMFRGQSFAIVEAVFLGDAERAASLVEPIRALGPDQDSFAAADPMALLALHMDPPGPVPGLTDHALLGDLSSAELTSLVEAIGPGADAPILSFELRLLGGAIAEPGEAPGALGAIEGRYIAFGVGMLAVPEMRPPLEAAFGKAREALATAINGSHFLNFTEVAVEAESAFDAGSLARLREIKQATDPENVIRGNHGLS